MRKPTWMIFAAAVVVTAVPAAAEWREATSDHFVVYADGGEEYVRRFAERLERYDAAMRVLRNLPDDPSTKSNRLTIYIPGGIRDVQKLCGQCPDIAGFYVPRAGGSVAYVPRVSVSGSGYDLRAETVLFHEYAHHFMLANTSLAFPRWLIEGFAEFYGSTSIERDGGVGIGRPATHRAYALLGSQRIPIEQLFDPPVKMSGAAMDVFYGRSWLLTHYLTLEARRAGQLARYLTLLNAGKANLDAAREVFGDLRQLDRDLDRYLAGRTLYYALPAERIRIGSIAVRTLAPGEAAMMPVRMRSDRGVDRITAQALVPEARRRAVPFPDDAAAQGALAEAEFDAGNLAEADAAADRALAANPKSMQGLMYKGRVALRRAIGSTDAAQWAKVRDWFRDANAIDNDAAQPLMLYYQSFRTQRTKPTANATAALLRAFELSPQDRGLRMLAAQQLLIDDKPKEARVVLLPLAYDPHNRGESNFAARLVEMIDAGKTPAPAIADQRPGSAEEPDGDDEP